MHEFSCFCGYQTSYFASLARQIADGQIALPGHPVPEQPIGLTKPGHVQVGVLEDVRHVDSRIYGLLTPESRARRQAWMKANAPFRRYVLAELRRRGPMASRELEDRAAVGWASDGWNQGRSLTRMLEILWSAGEVAIAGRDGNQRLWDLSSRHYPRNGKRMTPNA